MMSLHDPALLRPKQRLVELGALFARALTRIGSDEFAIEPAVSVDHVTPERAGAALVRHCAPAPAARPGATAANVGEHGREGHTVKVILAKEVPEMQRQRPQIQWIRGRDHGSMRVNQARTRAREGRRGMSESKAVPDPTVVEIARLASASVEQLVARYVELYGREPRSKKRDDLWKRIAWRLGEIESGGLSKTAKRRLERLVCEIKIPTLDAPTAKRGLTPGIVLTRDWNGRRLEVRVLDDQRFEFEGAVYKSLSAVAHAATGSHWNGLLFFGLSARKKKATE